VIGEGANLARTLANRSANDVSPEVLAEEAWSLADKHGLWIDVIGPEKAAELGMGLLLAVGRGSANPPRMIVMRSGRAGERDRLDRHLALVGKGVCFDSGGISLKPADRMDEMKMDKAGACTVLATIATLHPTVVAIAGVTAYRTAFGQPDASLGRQEPDVSGAQIWVIPNPSGLNAHETIDSLARWLGEVGRVAGLL